MKIFKLVVFLFCSAFYFTSILFAQVTVNNENDFRTQMNTASPDIRVSDTINFGTSFQTANNKEITISLDSGVTLDGSAIPSMGHGFYLSGSTLTFNFGTADVVSRFTGAFTGALGSVLNFSGNNIVFTQNSSSASGGSVFNLSGNSSASVNTNIVNFSLNSSAGSGGAVSVTGNSSFDVTASTILFRNNAANQNAGAIFAQNGSTVSLNASFIDFSGNNSGYSGGALYGSDGAYFNISADSVFFEDNSSNVGGIAYGSNAKFEFSGIDASFLSNVAQGNGGAFYAGNGSEFIFNATSNTFAGNESGMNGGVAYAESGSEFIFNGSDTYFDINKAGQFGGAIGAVGGSTITFASAKTVFNHNEAANGGAIHGNGSYFNFTGNEVLFAGNKADSKGGVLYAENNAVFEFHSLSNVFRHNSAADGGAIYMGASNLTIDNVQFLNNTASSQGGAIYMNGTSSADSADLTIRALTSDVLFSGNTASGKTNDIYMYQYGNIEFNAGIGRKITLEGGISARADFGNSVIKTGNGILEFAGDNSGYKGDIRVSAGTLSVINNADFSADKFTVDTGAVYSTLSNQAGQVTKVGNAQINGEMNIDIDLAAYNSDKMIADSSISSTADGKVNLNSTDSTLNVTSLGTLGLGTNRITIIEAEGGITGTFSNDPFASYIFPPNTSYLLEYLADRVNLYVSRLSSFNTIVKMTHNQKEVALALDEISKENTSAGMSSMMTQIDAMANDSVKKAAFDQLSGSFIANALTAGALRNGMNELYERVKPRFCEHKSKMSDSLWGQVYLSNNKYDKDENTLDDFSMTGYGIQAGYDLFTGENSLGGFYISYGQNNLEQGADEADMQDYGLGFYGGWFGERIDVKGSISGGMQNFDLKRNIKFAGLKTNADFNTYSFRADGQVEFKIGLGSGSLELKPFVGLQGGYVMSEEIKEKNGGAANLVVDSGDYLRITGLAGAGIGNDLEKFSWYGKLYAGYLMAGTQSEFDGKFSDNGKEMDIWGTELGSFGGGAGIGAEYNLTKQWSLYANANAGIADGSSGYYANVGINYNFCSDSLKKEKSGKEKTVSSDNSVEPEQIPSQKPAETKQQDVYETETPSTREIAEEEYTKAEEPAAVAVPEEKKAVEPEQISSQKPAEIKQQDVYETETSSTREIAEEEYTKAEEPAAVAVHEKKRSVEPETTSERATSEDLQITASFVPAAHGLNITEKERIKQQAEELKAKGYNKIVVRGHTDATGNDTINNRLSLQRAKAVYEELIANGIDPEKIEYVGYADRKPVASNATEDGMALNRRTEVVVDEPAIMPGVIYTASYFASNGYALNETGKEKVKNQTAEIKAINYEEIIIEGHADSTGNDLINNPLSERRAKTIYDEFIKNGIPAGKLSYKGYGSKVPVDTNSTRKGRSNNRRVEVIIK